MPSASIYPNWAGDTSEKAVYTYHDDWIFDQIEFLLAASIITAISPPNFFPMNTPIFVSL
jgi:hypothetical protein